MTLELKRRESKEAIAYALGLPTQWLVSFTVKVTGSGPLEVTAEYFVPETDARCTRMSFVGSPAAISRAVAAFILAAEADKAA